MTATVDRGAFPYRLPPFGAPLRVAFVGRESEASAATLHTSVPGLEPTFVDLRHGADPGQARAALDAVAPHVVVVLGAQGLPRPPLEGVDAVTLAVITEQLGRAWPDAEPDDAEAIARIAAVDGGAYDRVLAVDAQAAEHAPSVWRSAPLPVDDRLYAAVRPSAAPPRALLLSASTPYRDRFTIEAKHEFDVLHYAHGLWSDSLIEVLAKVDVGVNVHRDHFPRFEHAALVHLAAGHLLVSEPLEPANGLEPEVDYTLIMNRHELVEVLLQLRRRPEMLDRVRLRGRAKAEDYRASRVWPRIVGDLVADVAAFGTERAA